MLKSIVRKFINFIIIIRINFLDTTAPITSWIAMNFYRGYWVSNLARRTVVTWETSARKREKVKDRWYSIHQPENWQRAVVFAFSIIFFPQLSASLWFISPLSPLTSDYGWNYTNSTSTLETAWQVSAGLIGITFVIVIFLVEFANKDSYERRAIPIFLLKPGRCL